MEKKYIIKLEENEIAYKTVNSNGRPMIGLLHPSPYTEPDLDAIRKEEYEKGVQDTKQHWVDAPRSCAYKLGYENGLNDAWEAVGKIYNMCSDVRHKIFKENLIRKILSIYSASEAIEKIRQYEQEKKEIKVGDEVIAASGKAVVTAVGPVYFEFVYAGGSIGSDEVKNAKKTGRHFPEIAEVLQKMRE